MADVVASLESALISQNHCEELSSEQNEEDEANVDATDISHMFDSVQFDVSPIVQEENKKKSKGKISKAFQWSLRLFIKQKRNYNSRSNRSWLGSDSISHRSHRENSYLPYRRFTISEILAATNNFHSDLKLGEGGSGTMYKGLIDNGTLEVAIKSTKSVNADGLLTSSAEIQPLPQIFHLNVMSLLGYYADRGKLMLVYSYMVNRSLDDHLYGEGSRLSPLPWERRLEICLGAAKGLQYLHYGTTERIIHGDFKPSNILLDENWVAKISGFEMAKSPMSESEISTCVRGTYGYQDPEYICHLQLSEKTDVYAFGVVMLELVCARKPYDNSVDKEQRPLVQWFKTCVWQKQIDQIIDPSLVGKISPDCLMQYLKVVWDCLLEQGTKRPIMNSVVDSLQIAQKLQLTWHADAEIDISLVGRVYNDVLTCQFAGSFDHADTYTLANVPGNQRLKKLASKRRKARSSP